MSFFLDFCLYVFCRSWVAFGGSWGGLLGGSWGAKMAQIHPKRVPKRTFGATFWGTRFCGRIWSFFGRFLGCFFGSERGEVDKTPMRKDTRKMCFLTHYLQYIVAVGHFRKLAKSEQKSPKTPQTTCSKFMLFFREKINQKSTKHRPKIDQKSTNIVKKYQKNVTNRFLGALCNFLSLFEGLGAVLGAISASKWVSISTNFVAFSPLGASWAHLGAALGRSWLIFIDLGRFLVVFLLTWFDFGSILDRFSVIFWVRFGGQFA